MKSRFFTFLLALVSVMVVKGAGVGPIISGSGGISATNVPSDGMALFGHGPGSYYWDFPTNSPATNVVLTGDVTKSAGSTATTIAAGHVVASMMANDLDTNVLSATGYAHLIQLILATGSAGTNAAIQYANAATNSLSTVLKSRMDAGTNDLNTVLRAYIIAQINASTNDLSLNELTNKMNHGLGTNVFSQNIFDYLATLVSGGSQTPWAQDINGNFKAGTNINYIGFTNGATIIGTSDTNAIAFDNASGVPVFVINTNGATYIGTNNYVFIDTSGNLILKMNAGSFYGLLSSGAVTNVGGSRVIYLVDLTNGTNDLSGVLKTFTINSTNDLLATLTYTWVTNLINHRVGTNVFAQSAFDYFATLGGGGAGTLGNTNANMYMTLAGFTTFLLTNGVQLGAISANRFYWQTNFLIDASAGAKVQVIRQTGDTNGFMTVYNAFDYNLSTNSDNNAAFQLAIDTATNYGGIVYIPHGTWNNNNQLKLWPGVSIWGEAPAGGTGGNGSVLYSAGNDITNIILYGKNTVQGITIQGNGRDKGTGIRSIPDTSNVAQNNVIRQVNVVSLSNAFVFNYSWDNRIYNSLTVNTTHGLLLSNQCNDILTSGNHWTGSYFGVKSMGLNYHLRFEDTFEQISNATFFASGVPGAAQDIKIASYFENVTNASMLNGIAGVDFSGSEFVNNPNGTNIIGVGVNGALLAGHYYDPTPAWDFDSTSTSIDINPLFKNAGASYSIRAQTWRMWDGTNLVLGLTSKYYGLASALTNAAGFLLAGLNDATNTANSYSNGVAIKGITIQGSVVKIGDATLAAGSAPYFDAKNMSNSIPVLNTNQSGAAFKLLGVNGGSTFYQTNITAALTLASFDTTGCTQDHVYGFLFRVTANGNYLITGPNGSIGVGSVAPATFYSTNAQAIMGQVTLQPGIFTNIDFAGH